MTHTVTRAPEYAMYTEQGDAAVHGVVVAAGLAQWSWPQTLAALSVLAQDANFGEATDTAVRECVYDALKFDTPFYA